MTTTIAGLEWDIRRDTTDYNTVNACTAADEYELGKIDVFDKLVFDIGAHVGGVGIWLASRGARVVLVEPIPENVECIRKNALLNGVRFWVIEGAIGTDEIGRGPDGDPHEFIGGADAQHNRLKVERVYFEQLVDVFGLPDIVKLDCEGGEWEVFGGWSIQHVPLIVGEYHPAGGHEASEIAGLLPGHDVTIGHPHFGPFTARLRP